MVIRFHPHALERMKERGASVDEINAAIAEGEQFPAKFERTGFRRNFEFNREWRGKHYAMKQVEVYAIKENADWLVITIITRYF